MSEQVEEEAVTSFTNLSCSHTKATPAGRIWVCVNPDGHQEQGYAHRMVVAVHPQTT